MTRNDIREYINTSVVTANNQLNHKYENNWIIKVKNNRMFWYLFDSKVNRC